MSTVSRLQVNNCTFVRDVHDVPQNAARDVAQSVNSMSYIVAACPLPGKKDPTQEDETN